LCMLQISAIFHSPEAAVQPSNAPLAKTPSTPAVSAPAQTPAAAAVKPSPASQPITSASAPVGNASISIKPQTATPSSIVQEPPATNPVNQTSNPQQTTTSPRSFSIKINKSTEEEDEKKKDLLIAIEDELDRPEDSFNEDDLIFVWDKLKENYKNTSASIFTALNTHPPVLTDEISIEIGVDNLVQKDHIIEQKPQMLHFIRKNLNNYAVTFTVVVKESKKIQKAYLPAEKFQKMMEKNPDVEKLKNDLDLDLIY
jgi:DNA polymerase III subunit gamma/tau